jgi:hypothetical protein
MRTTTLSALRDRVRQKADIEGYTDRHPNDQLDTFINTSWRKLYGKLAVAHLLKNQVSVPLSASGATQYTLPDDFFAMYGVFEEYGRGHRELRMHNPGQRPFGRPGPQGTAVSYATAEVDGDHYIEFLPQPTSGTYVYVYVPEPNTLAADTDTIKGALAYDEYVVLDAAIQVLEKDGVPIDTLQTRLMLLEQQIDNAQAARDLLQSTHIRDVRGSAYHDASDVYDYSPFPNSGYGRWFR